MATIIDPTTEARERIQEQHRATRPPGWVPDGHRGPGDWLVIALTLSIVVIGSIAVGLWLSGDAPLTEPAIQGDALVLESLGPFMSGVAGQGDALQLERLGAWSQLAVAAQGDALELERLGALGPEVTAGDAGALEQLGAWTFNIDDVAAAQGDAFQLEQLGTFATATPEPVVPQGDALELERLEAFTP